MDSKASEICKELLALMDDMDYNQPDVQRLESMYTNMMYFVANLSGLMIDRGIVPQELIREAMDRTRSGFIG